MMSQYTVDWCLSFGFSVLFFCMVGVTSDQHFTNRSLNSENLHQLHFRIERPDYVERGRRGGEGKERSRLMAG